MAVSTLSPTLERDLQRAVAAAHHEEERQRPSMNQLGLWLFFLSESFLFGALLSARFYLAGTDRPHVNQLLGLAITAILLVSSLTAYRSEVSIAHGDRKAFLRYLLATIALGVIFAGGVAYEWSTAEFSRSEPYGAAFFSMTGLHASHVISGVAMLAMVYFLGVRGRFSADSHWGVEAVIKYWHFVDVVWVFFYPALYLVKL
ncbi:MAG: heme-copper oxidase subunit III [Dehalococcoidia bacterium]|nr:MAG: heme-copper oxidase subunit III [Dehalococcoidia bacterium]